MVGGRIIFPIDINEILDAGKLQSRDALQCSIREEDAICIVG